MIANIAKEDRSQLAENFSRLASVRFTKPMLLFDGRLLGFGETTTACHYPAVGEVDRKLFVLAL